MMNSEKDGGKPYSIRLFLVTGMLLVFTLAAAVIIIAWGSFLPEAIAVDINQNQASFSQYLALHESWHSVAATYHYATCGK